MQYRKDINGLRAYAVIAVVFYHFGISGFNGGFSGVDVFFVISGYLMTGIIFTRIESNNFSLWGFYLARAQRIIPALLVVCVFLMVAGWYILIPFDYRALGKHVLSSVFFFSNIIYWKESGYFDVASHDKWLLHTWSLSVEWQFYIFYPVFILLVKRFFGNKAVKISIIFLGFISFIFSIYYSLISREAAFFLLPTRAWEMIVGGLVFMYPIRANEKIKKYIEIVGVLLVIGSVFLLSSEYTWPGCLAAIPVAGSAAILISNRKESFFTGGYLFQFIGKISYSVYLWHWVIVVMISHQDMMGSKLIVSVGILISVLLGWLSYRFVESSFRGNKKIEPRFTTQLLSYFVLCSVVGCAGLMIFSTQGVIIPARSISVSPQAEFLDKYTSMQSKMTDGGYREGCDFYNSTTNSHRDQVDVMCTEKKPGKSVFLWGDSHAQALSIGLRESLPAGVAFYQVATSSCEPTVDKMIKERVIDNNCELSNHFAVERISQLKPDVVIIVQQALHDKVDWNFFAMRLYKLGVKNIVLLGPVPQWRPTLPLAIYRRHWEDESDYIEDPSLDKNIVLTEEKMKEKVNGLQGIEYVSMFDGLCHHLSCLARVPDSDELMTMDYGHLTISGSNYVAKMIVTPYIQRFLE